VSFSPDAPLSELIGATARGGWQDVFPVVGAEGQLVGLVTAPGIVMVASEPESCAWLLAADVMLPPTALRPDDDLRRATEVMVQSGLRELPVLDIDGKLVGFLDEADIAHSYVIAAARSERPTR
jgi:chloride channel protein, CIC family